MNIKFTKMQALGNDYIFINGYEYPNLLNKANELALKLSDRHFGIGGDGIIFPYPSKVADCAMFMFNSDGSESEMCGNGIRQLAKYVYDNKIVNKKNFNVETKAGIKTIKLFTDSNDNIEGIEVNMGAPILDPEKIPAKVKLNKGNYAEIEIAVLNKAFTFTLVSIGNPHAVTFLDNIDELKLDEIGPKIENNTDIFPKRTNVEFIKLISKEEINMRVWERGSGETFACGTGACASVVAGILKGLLNNKVKVRLKGGILYIEYASDGNVYMTGDAKKVFDGFIDLNYFIK